MKNKSYKLGRGGVTNQGKAAFFLCSPALIAIFIFYLLPFVMSVIYSFTNKLLVPRVGRGLNFVGLANYQKLFTSSIAQKAFINTGLYTLMVVPSLIILGTFLAVFVNRKLKGVKYFRAIYFSPQVVTMTVVAVVWSFIFSPGQNGLMNSFLGLVGISPQTWLQDTRLALFCIAIMYIWQSLGLQMIIILGGLQFIPEELYEAGYLDGCSTVQRFLYITIPLLKNTMVYVLISVTINTLKLFTQVYVLTDGGPKHSTTSVVYLLYKAGYVNTQLGYSSAIAVVFFLIVLVISLLQNNINSEAK